MIHIKEMELAEKEQKRSKSKRVLAIVAAVLLLLIGVTMVAMGPKDPDDPGYILIIFALLIGLWGGFDSLNNRKKDKRRSRTQNGVTITNAMAHSKGKNYKTIALMLESAGFSNIRCIPMNDLNFFTSGKNGQIESIVIDGYEDIEEGNIFAFDAPVIITYHSYQ